LLLSSLSLAAQTRYNMANITVNDCEGILVDSETGNTDFPTGYYHNENLTFTICVPNSDGITLNFSFFQTEAGKDFLYIYDGPDANSPLVGTYTGNSSPGTIVSSGDCLTIVFISDPNVNAEGWEATWTATPPPPPTPTIAAIPNISCGSTSFIFRLDQDVPCNQFTTTSINFRGPSTPGITSVTPLDCVNGFARTAQVNFNGPLNESGTYCFDFSFVYLDKCNQAYYFDISQCFQIIDCPLKVEIKELTEVCAGACIRIYADVSGGNPNNYQYTWSNGSSTDTITVCPTVQTTYSVSVTDGVSQPASDNHTVNVLPAPEAGADTTFCRFDADFQFQGTPAGGKWFGPGILPDSLRFRPSRNGTGLKTIFYIAPNGCLDSLTVNVHPVSTSGTIVACTGSGDVQLNGNPTGGSWVGPNVSPTGVFSPTSEGTFDVTYTEPNFGCQAIARINVTNQLDVPPMGTLQACVNQDPFNLTFSPIGGRWSGNGITNSYWGEFTPATAGIGTHKLYFTANGCIDSTNVTVFDISAGSSQYYCPTAPIVPLTSGVPAGGVWTGNGVIDNMDGTYDFNPNFNGNVTGYSILDYDFNGCKAQVYVLLERSSLKDTTLEFCAYDNATFIQVDSLQPNYPIYGTWSGPFFNPSDSILDIPAMAGNTSYIYYEVLGNGCPDSVQVVLIPAPNAGSDVSGLCPNSPDFNLVGTPIGGTWSGYGIIDPTNGTFSPSTVGVNGNYTVTYTYKGCTDDVVVNIVSPSPVIKVPKNYFCLTNQNFQLIGTPSGGTWSGNGINPSTGMFNPSLAGPGFHTINYTYGSGSCTYSATPVTLEVLEPLKIGSDYIDTTLCFGDSIPVTLTLTDGDVFKDYNFIWSPERPNSQKIYAKPDGPTTYSVKVSDGCSDTAFYSFTINSYNPINYSFDKTGLVCFGDSSWIKVNMLNGEVNDDYTFTWETYPSETVSDSLSAPAGKYKIRIQHKTTGCYVDDREEIASYPYINADFVFLQTGCLSIVDPKLNIIDLSQGGTGGMWDFGDTTNAAYDGFSNYEIIYPDSGDYTVTLTIFNAGGCTSSKSVDLCVKPENKLFLSNTFTPDGDGNNEVWPRTSTYLGNIIPMGYGIISYQFEVYTRWGELVYDSKENNNEPWNGRLYNKQDLLPAAVFAYKMRVKFLNGEVRQVFGHINLVR